MMAAAFALQGMGMKQKQNTNTKRQITDAANTVNKNKHVGLQALFRSKGQSD